MRLFDVNFSQLVLNGYDTTGNKNGLLEKCKCILYLVPPAIDFQKNCRSKPYKVTLATPTSFHGEKISFVSTKYNWELVVKSTNTKHAMQRRVSNKWTDWKPSKLLRIPVSQRNSGSYFNYQRSEAIWCSSLMPRRFSCTHQWKKKSFSIRIRISGHSSSSSRSIVSETTSTGLEHPTKISNRNWRGQSDLYQIVPKLSNAQEKQAHWDKISLHLGPNGRLNNFNSLRACWQNDSRNIFGMFARILGWNIQNSFDENRLYAISSILSEIVRISIQV